MDVATRDTILAECVRTIDRAEIDQSIRLSRRHRWKPLAYDVDADVATVVVATRGKRTGGSVTAFHFELEDGRWVFNGSGGGGRDVPELPPRPMPSSRWFSLDSAGTCARRRRRPWPARRRSAHHAVLRPSQGVAIVEVGDRRRVVAEHGYVCVVWQGHEPPEVSLLDNAGRRVDCVTGSDLSFRHRLPWRVRLRRHLRCRSRPGDWFNYAPRHP